MKRIVSLLLTAVMLVTMIPAGLAVGFERNGTWADTLFSDVSEGDWFYSAVKNACELDLMVGTGLGQFSPKRDFSLAETVTVAARIHAIYTTGEESFPAGTPWYQPYVTYALANGILTEAPADYTAKATRLQFAEMLSRALPAEALPAINTVEDGAIPNVADNAAIYLLYRAGILVGSDAKGTYKPETAIGRAEVAAIVSRMADPALREHITLTAAPSNITGTVATPSKPDKSSGSKHETVDTEEQPPAVDDVDENNALTKPFDEVYPDLFASDLVQYSGEEILIKLDHAPTGAEQSALANAGVTGLELFMDLPGTKWYTAAVEGDVNLVMESVRALSFIELAEYNYAYETSASIIDSTELDSAVQSNPSLGSQWYLHSCGIGYGWGHLKKPHKRPGYNDGTNEGGNDGASEEDVTLVGGGNGIVVAVIDTGVDYNHEDLKDNIWVNTGEIPGDGVDNDKNGYVDDYYGYNAVADKGSGMDDQGHGTHVAGIIAGVNNNTGIVGIAYNAKIMPIKAGMASGYFNSNDIAEAIIYAANNGADVINMSFGGSASTIAVQEALEYAFTRCVLVAAAGNADKPNENRPIVAPTYPAALAYVLGVMSVGEDGVESVFSNYDVSPFSSVEYEVYAPGESMLSTIPNNGYATWSGTSMAAPVVSGMAALLREEFRDPNTYPTKFIYGQISATGETSAICCDPEHHGLHNLPKIVDLERALTVLPKPEVGVQEYRIFDTAGLQGNRQNNGDGVIDAGETIALGFMLRNRWGMSEDTVVSIDAKTQGGLSDPYIHIITDSQNYGRVGTYSTQDAGRVMDGDTFVGWEKPLYIKIDEDCPNDYIAKINVTVTCANALDATDTYEYSSTTSILLDVRSGTVLPNIIKEDMVLTKDSLYIIPRDTIIKEGVTVTVKPGTRIQFWSDDPNDAYAENGIAKLTVKGTLLCEGTADEPIELFPSQRMDRYRVEINGYADGSVVRLFHTKVVNPYLYGVDYAEGCAFTQTYRASPIYYRDLDGTTVKDRYTNGQVYINTMKNCAFSKLGYSNTLHYYAVSGFCEGCAFVDSMIDFSGIYQNCVFYGNNNYLGEATGGTSTLSVSGIREINNVRIWTNSKTGTTYALFDAAYSGVRTAVEAFAQSLGGHLACINTEEELDFVYSKLQNLGSPYDRSPITVGMKQDFEIGGLYWVDGTEVGDFLDCTIRNGLDAAVLSPVSSSKGKIEVGNASAFYLIEIPAVYVDKIELDLYAVTLDTDGAGWQITATASPSDVANAALVYESLDPNVATVDESGYVTPVKPGTTTIRVYSPDRYVYNTLDVTVADAVALDSISLGENFLLPVGESRQLVPVFTPAETTKQNLIYTSNNEDVATVSVAGLITAVGVGEAVITATNVETGRSASVTVTGYIPVESVRLEESLYAANADAVETVEVFGSSVYPANATYRDLIWESSNEKVLCVDEDGNLIKGDHGVATLRATAADGGAYAEVTVCVSDLDTDVEVVQLSTSFNGDSSNDGRVIALLADGTIWQWGEKTPVPTKLPFENVAQFAYNWNPYLDSMLILDKEGELNFYRKCATPELKNESIADLPDKPIRKIDVYTRGSSDSSYYVLFEDGTVYAWGYNEFGQLATGSLEYCSTAVQTEITGAVDIVAADRSLYVLDASGNVYRYGEKNTSAMLYGTGAVKIQKDMTRTNVYRCFIYYEDQIDAAGHTWTPRGDADVACNGAHFYVEDGAVYVSGSSNDYGQLGVGHTGSTSGYERVQAVSKVSDIFLSAYNTFFQTVDGKFYSVGRNNEYQLGALSTASYETIPRRVYFGFSVDETAPTVEAVNAQTDVAEIAVLSEDALVLDYDQSLTKGSKFVNILLKDSSGGTISVKRSLKLDKLSIQPIDGFRAGETYTLTIPAGALANVFSVATDEVYTLTFAVSRSTDPTNSTPGTVDVPVVELPVHDTQINTEEEIERGSITAESITGAWFDFFAHGMNPYFYNNALLNRLCDDNVNKWLRIQGTGGTLDDVLSVSGNYWGTTDNFLVEKQIVDYDDFTSLVDLDAGTILTEAPENVWPFAVRAGLINRDGEETDVIGNERVTFFVEFNRDMDTDIPLDVRFGSFYPFADYEVDGAWKTARRWEGTTTLTTLIENGYQFWSINNGCAADNAALTLFKDWGRFTFEIDTSSALAMILQGNATDTGVALTWTQDDFATLAGYNVYRATELNGKYQKLNSSVIPVGTESFFDDTVEPGKVYYYNFTVVKTDLSESEPSGRLQIMSKDTMSPIMYHTPVYQAYVGSNVVISATVTDNVSLRSVKLHYQAGDGAWTAVEMQSLNDKYSAIISGDKVTLDGLRYYITASDGVSVTSKGSQDDPYVITVQEALGVQMLGDVDGSGTVTVVDALIVLRAINGKVNLNDEQFARADLDSDGVLTAAEAYRILKYANGEIGSLQVS